MNHKARRIIEQLACERRYGIADEKGAEYSGAGSTYKETGADTLHNFKSVAERTGVTPEQTLMTYLLKHMDSINTAVKEAAQYNQPYKDTFSPRHAYAKGEGIVSRLDDARNYLDLLECLLVDLSHIANPAEYAEIEPGPDYIESRSLNDILKAATQTMPPLPGAFHYTPTAWNAEEHFPYTDEGADRSMTPENSVAYSQEGVPEGSIRGFDGVIRPRVDPSSQIIPPICWGETGE